MGAHLRINLKARLPEMPEDWLPVDWAHDYDRFVRTVPLAVDERVKIVRYDDWEWICAVGEHGGRFCGPGALGFRDENEWDDHLNAGCGAVFFCCDGSCGCSPVCVGCIELADYELEPIAAGDEIGCSVSATIGPSIYLIQMHPDCAPRQIKAGFSTKLSDRLRIYRTGSPLARLIAAAPGTPNAETDLLRDLGGIGRGLSAEVFEVDSVDQALAVFGAVADRYRPEAP